MLVAGSLVEGGVEVSGGGVEVSGGGVDDVGGALEVSGVELGGCELLDVTPVPAGVFCRLKMSPSSLLKISSASEAVARATRMKIARSHDVSLRVDIILCTILTAVSRSQYSCALASRLYVEAGQKSQYSQET